MRVVDDQYGSPTWSAELADKLTVLITTAAPPSLYHLCNTGITTWYELALETVRLSGLEARIERCRTEDYPTLAPRPRYSVLDCSESEKIVGATAHWRSIGPNVRRKSETLVRIIKHFRRDVGSDCAPLKMRADTGREICPDPAPGRAIVYRPRILIIDLYCGFQRKDFETCMRGAY